MKTIEGTPQRGDKSAAKTLHNFTISVSKMEDSIKVGIFTQGFKIHRCKFERLHKITAKYGYSAAIFKGGYRKASNIEGFHPVIIFDIDDSMTIEQARKLLEGIQYLIVSTKSHQKPKGKKPPCDRFRIILPLDRAPALDEVGTSKQHRAFMETAAGILGLNSVDTAAFSLERFYTPAPGQEHWYGEGEVLRLDDILSSIQEHPEASPRHVSSAATREDALTALKYVPVTEYKDRGSWMRMLAAMHDAGITEEEARAWSEGDPEQYDEDSFNNVWQQLEDGKFGEKITKATLFKAAYENGMPKGDFPGSDVIEMPAVEIETGPPDIGNKGRPLSTARNLEWLMCDIMGLKRHYDVILKRPVIEGWADDKRNDLISEVISYAQLHGLPKEIVNDHYTRCIKGDDINPLLDAVKRVPWDGKDHIGSFVDRLGSDTGDRRYRVEGVTKWLVQSVAAWDGAEHTPRTDAIPKFELIWVLSGPQGARKTQTFRWLMSAPVMQAYFLSGAMLDTRNKDSIAQNTSFGMVELGEIDATFKKSDISDLKAFTSREFDEYRVPYARQAERYPRRTSYCGSVNYTTFMRDETGSRRFFVIEIGNEVIDTQGLDPQQLWAQAWELYIGGASWWIDRDEDEHLYQMQRTVNRCGTDAGVAGEVLMHLHDDIKKEGGYKKPWGYVTASSVLNYYTPRYDKADRTALIQMLSTDEVIRARDKTRNRWKLPRSLANKINREVI